MYGECFEVIEFVFVLCEKLKVVMKVNGVVYVQIGKVYDYFGICEVWFVVLLKDIKILVDLYNWINLGLLGLGVQCE